MRISPQNGFQRAFLSTPADIAIGGGAVGAGKTFALIHSVAPYLRTPKFNFAFFRRTYPELVGPDSIWEESKKIFPFFGGVARSSAGNLDWRFPSGARGVFAAAQYEGDIEKHRGKAYAFVGIDEIAGVGSGVGFTEHQFWYIQTRMRSMAGVRPFMRATTNPDPDSFVRRLVDWYLNCDGYPDPQKAGVLRYFIREGDILHWSEDRDNLEGRFHRKAVSFTFVPGRLAENKILLARDPNYITALQNLPSVERDRLLGGNWHVRRQAGDYFQRGWFTPVTIDHSVPLRTSRIDQIRWWDFAGTPVHGDQVPGSERVGDQASNDPDWTVGLKVSRLGWQDDQLDYVVEDVKRYRDRPGAIERLVLDTAQEDGPGCRVGFWHDPGQAGNAQAERIIAELRRKGFQAEARRQSSAKTEYAKLPSRRAEDRRVGYLPGDVWQLTFFNELESFPEGRKDDQIDALSGAILALEERVPVHDDGGGPPAAWPRRRDYKKESGML